MFNRPFAAFVVASIALASPVLAGGVANVSRSPIVVHTDLQPAIDAAQDGDVLLVHGGTYAGFTIDNRALAIFGVPGEQVDIVGEVEIRNVTSARRVVLSNVDVHETITSGVDGIRALYVSNCSGLVWFQDCAFLGADGVDRSSTGDGGYGGTGVELFNATSTLFVGCSLLGGVGGDNTSTSCFPACWLPGEGSAGLWARGATRAALYGCDALGGHGGNGGYEASQGGHGIFVGQATVSLFAANSSATGGDGGSSNVWENGRGGDGVRAPLAPATLTTLDCLFVGGHHGTGSAQPNFDGVPIFGASVQLAPTARTFTTASVARDGTSLAFTFSGEPGDHLYLASSPVSNWFAQLAANGVWAVGYPPRLSPTPLAVVGPSGSFASSWTTPSVAAPAQVALRFSQVYALPAAGGAVLATPRCTLSIDVAALSDCDGNGVFDVIDIVEGAADANANFSLDTCEAQLRYVDDDALPGGDGSLAAPFLAIQQGVDACVSGGTVIVFDGVYVGAQNREVDFHGKTLSVRSQDGAANCVIDCQSLGRAFHLQTGEGAGTRIQGITIVNGRIVDGMFLGDGAGVLLENGATAEITECVFTDCFAGGSGGAIGSRDAAAPLRVADCSFTSNIATTGAGVCVSNGSAVVLRCMFENNQGGSGGGIAAVGAGALELSHCTFLANSAGTGRGGAVYVGASAAAAPRTLRASHLLCAGNYAAHLGGAIAAYADVAVPPPLDVSITHSTFSKNFDGQALGAIYTRGATASLANCVFWADEGTTPAAELYGIETNLAVAYCAVDGGTAAITLFSSPAPLLTAITNVDPSFVDADGPDDVTATFHDNVYRLRSTSPCLDAGDALTPFADFTDIDADGDLLEPVPLDLNSKPRLKDLPSIPDTGIGSPPIDLGCYERQS
ncbi:MAG: right-handed parallel beta-helix repeat-containing protein [Planctomycetes bacterium]|nr:right-handed parallel beta-helix repeat-containing protein [Planctomycetota bacterium]